MRTPGVGPADDEQYRIVTFFHREEDGRRAADVLVVLNTQTDMDRHGGDLSGHLMQHVPGNPLWYRSYRMRADLRATYTILPSYDGGSCSATSRSSNS